MPVDPSEFLNQKKALLKLQQRSLQRALRSLKKCKADLHQCRHWEDVHHQGELLQAHLYKIKKGSVSVIVEDWLTQKEVIIALDRELEPYQQVEALFKRSRKLKKGIPFMERQIKRMESEVSRLQGEIAKIELAENEGGLQALQPAEKKKIKSPEIQEVKRYREYLTQAGLKIWVGKTAKDNDQLTFRLAHGSDWWLHVNGCPGSHVILKVTKNQEPDNDSLQDAMQVALLHSKAKDRGEAEICVTQCKYVTKARGHKPGQVQVSRHKNIFVRTDPARLIALKVR